MTGIEAFKAIILSGYMMWFMHTAWQLYALFQNGKLSFIEMTTNFVKSVFIISLISVILV